MLNVIDPARYAGAGTLVSEANRGVAELAVELLDVLSTSGQVAGRGHGAGEWSQAYDRAAATVAAELAHLVDALGSCVLLLDASGHNHARAEAAAAPYGLPGSALSRRRLRAVSAPQLPEAYGGNEAEPHGWSMLATHLGFYQWPGADIGRLRALAAAWQRAATALREAAYLPRQAAAELTYLRSPELPDAIAVCDRLGAATLTLADDCADLGASCSAYADRVLADRSRVAHEVEEFVAIAGTTEVVGDVVGLVTDGAGAVLGKLVQSGVVARYVARITALLSDLDLALPAARPALAAATDDRWLLAVADSKPVLAEIEADGAAVEGELADVAGAGVRGGGGALSDEEVIEAGWADRRTLRDHLDRHGADIGAKSEAEYVSAAQDLLRRARLDGLPTKISNDGTIRVFDPETNLFAAYRADGLARTIFRPSPSPAAYWAKQPGVLQ
jgi:hypothetical protein